MSKAWITFLACFALVGCASTETRDSSLEDHESSRPDKPDQTSDHHKRHPREHGDEDRDRRWYDGLLSRDDDEVDTVAAWDDLKRLFQPKQKYKSEKPKKDDDAVQTAALNAKAEREALADLDGPGKPVGELSESIVARVNGDAVLYRDLFAPIGPALAKAQAEMSPADFAKFRNRAIQERLRDAIERQLIIQEAKRKIPEQGIKRLEAAGDKEFGKRIESRMKQLEVNTEAELRRKLLEQGESLDQIKEYERGNFVARTFLQIELQPRLTVTRDEMLDYYQLHQDQFTKQSGVRWSEIMVNFEKQGSRAAARAKAEQLLAQLRDGVDFADLAKRESDGVTASQGGSWLLTTKGNLKVAAIDEAIFSLPVGKLSGLIEGPEGWHIVRVEEKVAGGTASFVDVQSEIRNAIREQKTAKESQAYVQELAKKAHITTIWDRPAATAETPATRR